MPCLPDLCHLAGLPPAAEPLGSAAPERIDIPDLGVQAPVVARGLDRAGAIDPPPYDQPGVVAWYAAGVEPGAVGTAQAVTGLVLAGFAAAAVGLLGARRSRGSR